MTASIDKIINTINSFLNEWNRHEWMQAYGEWASEEWDIHRENYDLQVECVQEALVNADSLDYSAACELTSQLESLLTCIKALDSQVLPDDSDYIAQGIIDPDEIKDKDKELLTSQMWTGWDCKEGWDAYRLGDDLVLNWWRDAYGERHQRDLWMTIEKDFFLEDD